MELLVMNETFEGVATIDIFESLIWTDRYCGYGDFELYTPCSVKLLNTLKQDLYLYNRESEYLMIIEDIQIDTDPEEGAHLTITGRSLESILERRIIWNQTTLSGSLQDGIKKLLDENVMNPSNTSRKIPNFVFKASTDPKITSLTLEAQYFGDNLYDVIKDICEAASIGFRVLLNDSNQFEFSLYAGVDRSYNQVKNPYIVFSPGYDNLLNSSYISSKKTLKTVTLIAGEGEGSEKKTATAECFEGAGTGLSRREMYTDGSGISQTVDDTQIPEKDYLLQLQQKGAEELSKNVLTESFEGEVATNRLYKYGSDYYLGDIVQNGNEFGIEAMSRITEYVMSQSTSGLEMYPTFSSIYVEKLPLDYIRLNYIESIGTCYIDTGVTPNQNTRVICDFARTASNDTANKFLFNVRDTGDSYTNGFGVLDCRLSTSANEEGNIRFDFYKAFDDGYFRIQVPIPEGVETDDRMTVEIGKDAFKVNTNVYETGYTGRFTCSGSLPLFGNRSYPEDIQATYVGRLYGCKIYSGESIIRNFIPAINAEKISGLYDVVGKKFYSSEGPGAFIPGY